MHAELVDRADETAAFEALLAGDLRRPRALVISGEPGIGKTRLLAEFASRANQLGLRVACGQAAEYEQQLPLAAVTEAMSGLGCAAVPGPGNIARHELFAAVRSALAAAAGRTGLVVLLDDLHWADQATVELLGYLLRQPGSAPVLLVLAYRPRQVSVRLADAVAAATSAGRAQHFELAPLTVEQAHALVGLDRSEGLVRRLHAESGGNPLYLLALARRTGSGNTDVDDLAPLPVDIGAMLSTDLEGLTATTRRVAHAAAVLGPSFDAVALGPVAELPAPVVTTALDELARADVLREDGTPGRLRFRHPLLRRAAYEQAGSGWRLAAHARAAELFAAQHAPGRLWAHHVERCAAIGDDRAVEVLAEAAADVRFSAPRSAARWFGAAARLLPATDEATARRNALLLARAEALSHAGQLQDSRAVVGELLGRLPPGSADYLRAVRHTAQVEQLLGAHDEAAAVLRRGLRAATGPDVDRLLVELAGVELIRGEFAAAQDAVEQAMAAATGRGGHEHLVSALGIVAVVRHANGDTASAATAADQGGVLMDGLFDVELARQLRAVVWLGWVELLLGHYHSANRRYQRGAALARSTDQLHLLPPLLVGQGSALRWLGRLPEARACFAEAVEVARLTGADLHLTLALTGSCRLEALAGDLTEARRVACELAAAAARTGGWFGAQAQAVIAGDLAETELAAGSVERIVAACGGPGLPLIEAGTRAEFYELLTRAALRAGDVAGASAWAARAGDAAARVQLPVAAGFAALAKAQARLAGGAAGSACRSALDAVAAFEGAGTPVEMARAGLAAGRALSAAAQRGPAVEQLNRARAQSAGCATNRLHDEIVRELRRLGQCLPYRVGHRDIGPVGPSELDALSPREREVAELVKEGRTNREIAGALFLSVKTVERHLGRMFCKLDIQSRAALAAMVAADAGRSAA